MTKPYEVSYPAKSIGRIHLILLTVGFAVNAATAVFTAIYVYDFETYMNLYFGIDQSLIVFATALYYVVLATYFIWLVQVHGSLRRRYPDYRISNAGAIVRMLPLVNLWGIGSTFSQIGGYLYRRQAAARFAKLVHGLIVPLYIVVFVGNSINRLLLRNPEGASDALYLTGAVIDVAAMAVYLAMTLAIDRGLRLHYAEANDQESSERSEPFEPYAAFIEPSSAASVPSDPR
ncbi:hypothetical protein [Paenibacillus sp.]|uniref:hypothetical protein n=1 Tax=Paenibacillus sp. TaxID=58172 RepID=UPI002D2DC603|nr:hypothetical protein [Paenibacillus sp.]HZG87826.1 hypothetical protein [Paenibacillus sp.]